MSSISKIGSLLVLFILATGCSRFSDIRKFNRNDALVAANGTIVLKGFGGADSGSVVCIAPVSPYSTDLTDSTKASVEAVEYGKGSFEKVLGYKTALAFQQTERLQALRELLTQLCIAYGNGVFGAIGQEATTAKYRQQLEQLFDMYAKMDAYPIPDPQAAPTTPPQQPALPPQGQTP